ncbi:SRPBCC domain-containing protein [Nannocystis punicea]|uniref:SRPBCC domain-containing protein n=1 Tax=Nannocystis punicea TaxID=2995304 RepID=A0ABY7H0H6_9BACT|nr:SRPBCC domain-containing protein [Nannocystis poenicansa]WAS92642.1 SRPBCC domain-containing protein [Nannocystis poenicansa]
MTGPDDSQDREIVIVRMFDAPRELVFDNWIRPEHVREWFAPEGYTTTDCEVDARPGGTWRVEYRSDRGARFSERGRFTEVSRPHRLSFTLTQVSETSAGPETVVTVSFTEVGSGTEMRFHQTGFESTERRDGNAEGWGECFGKLARHLADTGAAEVELRALYDAWSRATAAKDLDASMAPIARDVVSYEHEAPLQLVGVEAVREVCRRGLTATQGDVRWDVPDLRILVHGDLAVTWGLNRMHAQEPGQPPVESWSRGTRVFRKIDGAWQLVHQHVSFPYDPQTLQAVLDLRP